MQGFTYQLTGGRHILLQSGRRSLAVGRAFENSVDLAQELFERDLVLEIRGSKKERRRAKKYAEGL